MPCTSFTSAPQVVRNHLITKYRSTHQFHQALADLVPAITLLQVSLDILSVAASSNRSHGTKYFKNSLLPTMWDSLDLGLTHPTFDQPTQFAVNEHENRPSMGGLGELNSITAHGRPSRATMTLNTNDWSSTSSTYSCHTAQQPRYNIVTSSIPNRQVFNPSIETPQYTTPPLTKSSPKPSPPPEENLWRWVLVGILFCIVIVIVCMGAILNRYHMTGEHRFRRSMRRIRRRVPEIAHELRVLRPGFDGADEERGDSSSSSSSSSSMPQRLLQQQQTSDWDETDFSSEFPSHQLGGSAAYLPLSTGSDGSEGSRREVQVRNETSMAADAPVRLREENSDGEDRAQDVREQQAAEASPIPAPLAEEPHSLEEYIEEYNNRRRPHERQRSSAA
ncbi:MAG: hypothetical protein Q9200_006375 [Gallowayella weberi]